MGKDTERQSDRETKRQKDRDDLRGSRGNSSSGGFLSGRGSHFGRGLSDSIVDSRPVGSVLDVPGSFLGASRQTGPFGSLSGSHSVPVEGRADRGRWTTWTER